MADKSNLEETFDNLKQKRDELKVKLNLGKMEARDTWNDVEKNFQQLETKMKGLRDQGEAEADRMKDDIQLLMSDIRDGFKRVTNRA
jgi:predicted  nucleic acid-binding Zn-ribbon protein